MPRAKKKSNPNSEVPGTFVRPDPVIPFTDFERSRLIIQLRHEIAIDNSKAYRHAAQSNLTPMDLMHRTMLLALSEGYDLQAKLLKSMLAQLDNVARDRRRKPHG